MVRGGDGIKAKARNEGYRYISQLGEIFYQSLWESFIISTYSISIIITWRIMSIIFLESLKRLINLGNFLLVVIRQVLSYFYPGRWILLEKKNIEKINKQVFFYYSNFLLLKNNQLKHTYLPKILLQPKLLKKVWKWTFELYKWLTHTHTHIHINSVFEIHKKYINNNQIT